MKTSLRAISFQPCFPTVTCIFALYAKRRRKRRKIMICKIGAHRIFTIQQEKNNGKYRRWSVGIYLKHNLRNQVVADRCESGLIAEPPLIKTPERLLTELAFLSGSTGLLTTSGCLSSITCLVAVDCFASRH